ncbi:MAG: RimK family protein [Leptospiraceae bacterium]|nr:RimK family protein [Leptospiraceae bacterium]
MEKIIVVNDSTRRDGSGFDVDRIRDVPVVTAREYLTDPDFAALKKVRVFNLCYPYRYQTRAYYVSLLAEARGHKVIPGVMTMRDLNEPTIIRIISDELDSLIEKTLSNTPENDFFLNIYFGRTRQNEYGRLGRELYNLFPAPLLRARFVQRRNKNRWMLHSIRPLPFNDIPPEDRDPMYEAARVYFDRKRYSATKRDRFVYDMAILINPDDPAPPSDTEAINRFATAAEHCGFSVEIIGKGDYSRVGEFDALFLRETTAVNHHTYRFARKAQADGLVVIDDPDSILKCTNKVYLAELLGRARIATPDTLIVHDKNRDQIESRLGFPCVLKLPDSSFSQGVIKVTDHQELQQALNKMLTTSDLVIAQKFTPTEFDWRIGLIDGKPLFACKYFMARDHWQIYNWEAGGNTTQGNAQSISTHEDFSGEYESLPISAVPAAVLQTAIRASRLIGDGLYGVDLKEINGQPSVIEVNDNPNIDSDIEDAILKEELYNLIMQSFLRRLEQQKRAGFNSADLK